VLDLDEVVVGLEPMLRRVIGEDILLETRVEPARAKVHADRGQIEQMLVNLAVNARDAMPEGGRLRIGTGNVVLDERYVRERIGVAPGPYVVLRVEDNGHGMDAETQARLFEPFFTTKPAGRGTGLGLTTVFGIAQQSGGHIDVSSAPGQGTTFEIYLPAVPGAVPAAGRGPSSALTGLARGGCETILLVEDEQGVRWASRRFLEEWGYRVLEAADGASALRLCDEIQAPLDLVITDIVMPGMNGRELAERIGRRHPHVPVLYVSGYVDGIATREALRDAAARLLYKPFGADALVRKVRQVLDAAPTRPVPPQGQDRG
jgi:two-component system, cell cycle sensor histidine kinase and response regulator CckA